jgi:glycine oxidase
VSRVIDYLIVGQGLAGSVLSGLCELNGLDVVVVDNGHRTAASASAAGIMNPITGKRLNRPHLVDRLLIAAFAVYPRLEALLGTAVFHRRTVLRLLQSEIEQRQWETRLASGEYAKYISPSAAPAPELIKAPFGGFEVTQAGHLDVPHFIQAIRNRLLAKNRLLETQFNYAEIRPLDSGAEWREYTVRGIIFCEGYQMFRNPYFSSIELNPAKGEILTLDAPDFRETRIVQHGKWIFRTPSGLVKAGTTYSWDPLDETSTAAAREQIEAGLRKFTQTKFRVVDQTAGVRPIIRADNRPIIGRHPIYRSLAILNGLGSKGVLQAPFAAEQLIAHLEQNEPVHPDFDVCRSLLWPR